MSLHDLQQAIRVAKDKHNKFGGYNYRTAEGILAAAKAVMPKGGFIICNDHILEIGGRLFVKATASVWFGDTVHNADGYALHPTEKKGMDPSQITGAASSYARKNALCGLLAIDDSEQDPDSKDNRQQGSADKEPPKTERDPAAVQQSLLRSILGATDLEAMRRARHGDGKFTQAWDWLEVEAPDKAKALAAAFRAKELQLEKSGKQDIDDEVPF